MISLLPITTMILADVANGADFYSWKPLSWEQTATPWVISIETTSIFSISAKAGHLMGEAKRKLEATRAELLETLAIWEFPLTTWEVETVAELKTLPVIKVLRGSDEQLASAGMPARDCHANARFLAENDPEGLSTQITGWWPQNGNYVLHSIVNQRGKLWCVTPTVIPMENPFDFIPDSKIQWRAEGEFWEAYRDGTKIGPGVREDASVTLNQISEKRMRLLSGMNPYEAMR